MAHFPQRQGTATTARDISNPVPGDYVIPLPTGIVAGELIIVLVTWTGTGTTMTPSNGFTSLYRATSTNIAVEFFYKTAAGGETTATFTPSANTDLGYVCQRISNWTGTPAAGTAATGISGAPNPPSVTASWGSDDNLFIVPLGWAQGTATAPTPPTNYTGLIGHDAAAINAAHMAFRELASATDDPGNWAITSTFWAANTVVIRGIETPVVATIPVVVHHRKQQGIQ